MSLKKILVITLIIILSVGIIWTWKPWEIPQKAGEEEGAEGKGEEVSGENQITGPILFSYEASFQYLSLEDNESVEQWLYLAFPCPNIDNESVISDEDITWQIWAYYEENGVPVEHLQMENNIPGEFVSPRENAPLIPPPIIWENPHGPKVRYMNSCAWNVEEMKPLKGAFAFYQNEVIRIEAEFTIPRDQANEVTLTDDRGEVWVSAKGYATEDNLKIFDGEAQVKLSKWDGTHFETIFKNSSMKWEISSNEWQCYRLNA